MMRVPVKSRGCQALLAPATPPPPSLSTAPRAGGGTRLALEPLWGFPRGGRRHPSCPAALPLRLPPLHPPGVLPGTGQGGGAASKRVPRAALTPWPAWGHPARSPRPAGGRSPAHAAWSGWLGGGSLHHRTTKAGCPPLPPLAPQGAAAGALVPTSTAPCRALREGRARGAGRRRLQVCHASPVAPETMPARCHICRPAPGPGCPPLPGWPRSPAPVPCQAPAGPFPAPHARCTTSASAWLPAPRSACRRRGTEPAPRGGRLRLSWHMPKLRDRAQAALQQRQGRARQLAQGFGEGWKGANRVPLEGAITQQLPPGLMSSGGNRLLVLAPPPLLRLQPAVPRHDPPRRTSTAPTTPAAAPAARSPAARAPGPASAGSPWTRGRWWP